MLGRKPLPDKAKRIWKQWTSKLTTDSSDIGHGYKKIQKEEERVDANFARS